MCGFFAETKNPPQKHRNQNQFLHPKIQSPRSRKTQKVIFSTKKFSMKTFLIFIGYYKKKS